MIKRILSNIRWARRSKERQLGCPYCETENTPKLKLKKRRRRISDNQLCNGCWLPILTSCSECGENLDDLSETCWNCSAHIYPPLETADKRKLPKFLRLETSRIEHFQNSSIEKWREQDLFKKHGATISKMPAPWLTEDRLDFIKYGPKIFIHLETLARIPSTQSLNSSSSTYCDAIQSKFEGHIKDYSDRMENYRLQLRSQPEVINYHNGIANLAIDKIFQAISDVRIELGQIVENAPLDSARVNVLKLLQEQKKTFHPNILQRGSNELSRAIKSTARSTLEVAGFVGAAVLTGGYLILKFGGLDLPLDNLEVDMNLEDIGTTPEPEETLNKMASRAIEGALSQIQTVAAEGVADSIYTYSCEHIEEIASFLAIPKRGSFESPQESTMGLVGDFVESATRVHEQMIERLNDRLSQIIQLLAYLRANELCLIRQSGHVGIDLL